MFELTQEVERLQQQVADLGHNSKTLGELVAQVDAFAIPFPPSVSANCDVPPPLGRRSVILPPKDRDGEQESWARRTLRQSQAMERAQKQRMIGSRVSARVSGLWDEEVNDEDVTELREELLKVQFQRLDSEKTGYLSSQQLLALAQRFEEPMTEEEIQRLCESLADRSSGVSGLSKDGGRVRSGLRFGAFCTLMAPDEDSEDAAKAQPPTFFGLKRALRAEAQERLIAEQERRYVAEKNRMHGFFATVFDLVTVAVIISNALVMGFSTDFDPESTAWDVTEVGFFVFYLLEYLIKLRTQSCRGYYTGAEAYWNWFDNTCLMISFIDLLLTYIVRQTAAESNTGSEAFMLVRMLRLARLARLVRLMRFRMFRELKLMVLGLFSGLRALAWAIVLLMFTIYTFGVLMRLTSDLPEFSSMSDSMFTLFRCFVTDGCVSYDGTPLPEKLRSDMGIPFFIMYILTTMVIGVGLFNLIMAVFIDNVLKSQGQRKLKEIGDTSATVCTELKLQFRRFLCEDTTASNRGLFSRLSASAQQKLSSLAISDDYYRDQASKKKIAEATYRILQEDQVSISRDMFTLWLQDAEFTTMLEEADVDMSDKFRMFDILDVDMGGELSADELVTGLMQLRGDVSKGDIVAIMLKVRHLTYAIEEIQQTLKTFCPRASKSPSLS